MIALWLASGVLDGAKAPVPQPETTSPGGSLWWRETLPRPATEPADDGAAELAARNAYALILLLT